MHSLKCNSSDARRIHSDDVFAQNQRHGLRYVQVGLVQRPDHQSSAMWAVLPLNAPWDGKPGEMRADTMLEASSNRNSRCGQQGLGPRRLVA